MVKKTAASVNSVILIKILIYAGILCFVFGLAGYAYMGSFIRLIGDDYCYAGVMNQYGFWGGQAESYFHSVPYHGDRYFLTLISFIFSLLPAKINGWIPLLTLVIFSVGNAYLIGSLLKRWKLTFALSVRILLGVATAYFTMLLAPTVYQSLYFRSAMLPSFAPIIGTVFLVGWLLRMDKPTVFNLIAIMLFAFFNGGFSENGAAFQGVALGIVLIAGLYEVVKSHWKTARPLALPISGIIGTLASIVVMCFSPSISDKLAEKKISMLSAIKLSAHHTLDDYIGFFSTKYVLVFALIVFGFLAFLLGRKLIAEKSSHNSLWKTLVLVILAQVISLALIFALMIPSAYSRGAYPDPRHLIGVSMVMVLNMIFVGGVLGSFLSEIIGKLPQVIRKGVVPVAAILVIALGILYPVRYFPQALQDRLLFQFWSERWDLRDTEIRAAAENGDTEVHVFLMDHIIEGVAELTENPERNWYNQCAGEYYNINIFADQPGWEKDFSEFLSSRQ